MGTTLSMIGSCRIGRGIQLKAEAGKKERHFSPSYALNHLQNLFSILMSFSSVRLQILVTVESQRGKSLLVRDTVNFHRMYRCKNHLLTLAVHARGLTDEERHF